MYDFVLSLAVLSLVVVCVWYARSGCFSVFHPLTLYLAFHGFLFVFRPIVARALDFRYLYNVYKFYPTDATKSTAILVATLGMLSFAFFCLRQGDVAMRFNIDRVTAAEHRRLMPAFLIAAAICFPIGLYSLITSWNDANEGAAFVTSTMVDRATQFRVNTEGSGYLKEAQLMLASSGAILAWLFRFRLLALLPLATFLVLRAGTGGRGPFVAGAATLSLLWLYNRRQNLPSPRVLLGVALVIASFNFVGQDRGRAVRQWLGTDQNKGELHTSPDKLKPMEGADFANLEYLEYVVWAVPEKTQTYSWFTEELMLFTEPIPRVLWPGKPVGPPIKMYNLFDYGTPYGMTPSMPGVGWSGAGWGGVVFWCGLWGFALGWLYRKFALGPQTAFQTAAYMILLSSLIVGFRDGSPISVARQDIFFMAPLVLWLMCARLLSVPSAAEVRRRVAAAAGKLARSQVPAPPLTARQSALPPAVARRRAAVAALRAAAAPQAAE